MRLAWPEYIAWAPAGEGNCPARSVDGQGARPGVTKVDGHLSIPMGGTPERKPGCPAGVAPAVSEQRRRTRPPGCVAAGECQARVAILPRSVPDSPKTGGPNEFRPVYRKNT